jgi:hypothetical protein
MDAGPKPLRLGQLVAGAAVLLAVLPSAAGADPPSPFVGLASADGLRASVVVPGQFVVEEIVDAGGPVAQASLDPQSGQAFSALPYPGSLALNYQGLLNVATGVSSPYPYPFYASATYPGTPKGEVADPSGAYHLLATTDAGRSGASARFGPAADGGLLSGVDSSATVTRDSDRVVSTAETMVKAVSLGGGALTISGLRSHSVTTYRLGAAKPTTETSLTADAIQAGELRLGLGPDGIVILGRPVPFSAADVNRLVAEQLGPRGLNLRFVAPTAIAGGARSAVLEITTTTPPGPNGAVARLTLQLGAATSAVSVGEAPLPVATGAPASDVSVPGPGTGPADAPAAVSGAPTGRLPAPDVAAPLPGAGARLTNSVDSVGASLSGAALGSDAAGAAGTAPAASPPEPGGLAVQPIVQPRPVRAMQRLYGVLGAGAALAFLATMAWAGRREGT